MEATISRYLLKKMGTDGLLARYMNRPAVFDTVAPDDTDTNWEKAQYPRCIFQLDMQADPERKISGRLFVDVMCENKKKSALPEELEAIVKAAVDGCFFSTPDLTISAQWKSSDIFSEKDNKLSGITLSFDVLAYPVQETESPDPVLTVNLWLKTLFPKAYVIGRDKLPETWKPTDDSPALYCRLFSLGDSSRMNSTAAVTWLDTDMRVNVMAPSEKVRSTICKSSIQILTNATRLMLDDGSPMLINTVHGNMGADPLREGQIQIKTTYGVLNTYQGTPLDHIFVTGKGAAEHPVLHTGSTDEDALTDDAMNLLMDNDGSRLLAD